MRDRRHLDFDAVRVFAAVAEGGGFTAGAQRLGINKVKASLAVARLEKQLGVSLFARTTRRVMLTDAGHKLYAECVPLLRQAEAAAASVQGDPIHLTGRLRLTATVDHAAHWLAKAVALFSEQHPELQIELISSDAPLDLMAEGIDVAIRMGWLRNSSLRATKLVEFEQYILASPDYLKRAGTPTQPEHLSGHAWVAISRLASPLTWTFTGPSGEKRTVRVQAKLRVDTAMVLRTLLESGAGISALDSLSSAAAIRAGSLKRLLSRWALPKGGVYAVCPPGAYISPAARAFIDFYRDHLRNAQR